MLTSLCFVQVYWVQQQHEKRRSKRDYSESSFPAFGDYPSFFGTGAGLQEDQQQHQPQYRGIGPHNVFPDPLFKEQWYLVSTGVTVTIICLLSYGKEHWGVAPNRGEALHRKPEASTLKSPPTIWAAELRNTDSCGG